uniref:Spermatogenesis associated 16 n=1 Tax=Phasianus colchicus TaxID=9054 RepID=A0A669QZ06_PHACC
LRAPSSAVLNEGINQLSEQLCVAANKLNDIPETLQEVKNHLGDGAVGNITERIKEAETEEEKQSNDVGRASPKWKSENNEKQAGRKAATKLQTGNHLTPAPLSHIPLNTLMHVERELVYADEEEIAFEFAVPAARLGRADATSAAPNAAVPRLDEQLRAALQEASRHYRQKNYAVAAGRLATALQLCSKGAAVDNSSKPSPEDISSIASFIEMKLAACYLKLRKPDLALNHSHRSIILNPAYFRNHLCQAAVFKWLERYSEAARSAMIADYMYWLTGGTEQRISKLIKLYWQAMIEEAITREESFSVMYTPFVTKVKADDRDKMTDAFTKKHPGYTQHIFTDPRGLHILPQTTDWSSSPPQQYLLTLGFRNKQIGKILEKLPSRKLPIFSDCKIPFSPIPEEELRRQWETIGKQIMPVMDFMRSTKLTDDVCACSHAIEKLHYASILGQLQQVTEQSQVINQAMAELASIPYLQDISQQDAELLQSLMADAMDTLEGRRSDKERAWNEIEKVKTCSKGQRSTFSQTTEYMQKATKTHTSKIKKHLIFISLECS